MKAIFSAILVASMIPLGARAQTSCRQPLSSEFRAVLLTKVQSGLEEEDVGAFGPVQMAIAPDGRIFIAKMYSGEIRVHKPTSVNPAYLDLVGTIPTWAKVEDGLLGIALDRNFATNNWLYAFYSDPCGLKCTNRAMELARFTITDNKLTAKKVILRFPRAKDDDHHASGGLAVDDNGVIVIGAGDNADPHDVVNAGYAPINTARSAADAQLTSSNSNDLRGKIIRIKPMAFSDDQNPIAGVGTTYEIPSGNLWEKIDKKAFNPGWDQTDSLSRVRKEIFSMGHRNPFHVRVDSKTGWIFWGEVGPDAPVNSPTRGPTGYDEWNLATQPGFFGHPYCIGYNVPWNMMISASPPTYGQKFDCALPENISPNNTGIRHLPPSVPALVAYASGNSTDDDPRFNTGLDWSSINHSGETAIGGPMYRFNPMLNSSIKFPAYFEGKVLFFDWYRQNFRWITLNSNGTIPAGNAGVENFSVPNLPAGAYIDMQYGPDGAMYLLKFSERGYTIGQGPQLFRIEYTGAQDAACYKPFVASVGPTAIAPKPILNRKVAPMLVNGVFNLPMGYRKLNLSDLSGRRIWSYKRETAPEPISVRFPSEIAHSLLQAEVLP